MVVEHAESLVRVGARCTHCQPSPWLDDELPAGKGVLPLPLALQRLPFHRNLSSWPLVFPGLLFLALFTESLMNLYVLGYFGTNVGLSAISPRGVFPVPWFHPRKVNKALTFISHLNSEPT